MRTLLRTAFLAGLAVSTAGLGGPVLAADLDHYYVPPPARFLPPPPPRCGYDRPCLRPYRRFGYVAPYGYVVPPYHHAYDPYGYEHDGYGRPRQNVDRYGYDRPPGQPYEHLGFDRLDRYGDEERRRDNERYERPRPGFPVYDPYDPG